MSRIFDALQRSGAEQSGVLYPDMVSVATEVFEAPSRESAENPATGKREDSSLPKVEPLVEESSSEPETVVPQLVTDERHETPSEFPSLEVAVAPTSRLVYITEPDSLAAEKFRFLGVRLRQMRQHRPLKKVLVTSTIPEEGKSLVSANLAGVLARRKEKVLLVEGDMRRPAVAQQFGLGRLAGLAEWLLTGSQKPSNIYHLGGAGFWLMPAGNPPANPLELMQSGRLSFLMGQLASMFDWVIVDSPPILPLADTTVWARLTDGTLLVAREGTTQKAPLKNALAIIKKSDLLGVVLNSCSQDDHHNYYQRYAPPGTK
jgi:capsular exopolysaccharide synthesis family protein